MTEKTYTELLREKVTSEEDVQSLIQLFTDMTIVEGDWTIRYSDEKHPLYSRGQKEWAEIRKHLTDDVSSHSYDITRWSPESIAALTLFLLETPRILRIMRSILLAVVDAHSRDEQTAGISRLIHAIIEEGHREEEKGKKH